MSESSRVTDVLAVYGYLARSGTPAGKYIYIPDGRYDRLAFDLAVLLEKYVYPLKSPTWNDAKARELLGKRGYLSQWQGSTPGPPDIPWAPSPPGLEDREPTLPPVVPRFKLPEISPMMMLGGMGILVAAVLIMKT